MVSSKVIGLRDNPKPADGDHCNEHPGSNAQERGFAPLNFDLLTNHARKSSLFRSAASSARSSSFSFAIGVESNYTDIRFESGPRGKGRCANDRNDIG